LGLALVIVLTLAGVAAAQDASDRVAGAAIAGTMMLFFLVFGVGM
jgi:hypothetical protein